MEEIVMRNNAIQLIDMMAEKNRDINLVKNKIKDIISDDFDKDFLIFELSREKLKREYKILEIEYDALSEILGIKIQELKNTKIPCSNLVDIILNDTNNMRKELDSIFQELQKMIKEV